MSEKSTPQPEQGRPSGASGAEAPGQTEQHAPAAQPEQAPPAQPEPQPTQPLQAEQPVQAPPAQPQSTPAEPQAPPVAQPAAVAVPAGRPPKVRRSPSDTTRLVVAAGVGAALLAIGGIGGYFIGAASHDGPDRPGMVWFGDGERMRGPVPGRPGMPDRPGDIRELPAPQPR